MRAILWIRHLSLFVFVWFSDNRRLSVFVSVALLVLLFFIVIIVQGTVFYPLRARDGSAACKR